MKFSSDSVKMHILTHLQFHLALFLVSKITIYQVFFVLSFHVEKILNVQKNYKNNTESAHISFTHPAQMLTSCIITVQLPELETLASVQYCFLDSIL